MTEKSWPWSTVTGLGDGSAELGESDTRAMLALYFGIQDPTSEGVSKGVLNELEVTGVASPLQVDTGSAISYGLYFNDAAVNVAVATPAIGTTGGRIVLQTNWAGTGGASLEARTRIALKLSADGVAAIPALTQSAGTTWEISLATFTITTGGVITVTDDRTFRKSTAMVGSAEIEDGAVGVAAVSAAVAGLGLVGGAGSALDVNPDGSTLEISGDVLRVKAGGIDSNEIAADAVGSSEISTGAVGTTELADLAVSTVKIAAEAVTPAKIANKLRRLPIPVGIRSGYNGSLDITGFLWSSGEDLAYYVGFFTVPDDYVSGGDLVVVGNANATGNIVIDANFAWGKISETTTTHTDAIVNGIVNIPASSRHYKVVNRSLVGTIEAGDNFYFYLRREATHVSDTLAGGVWLTSSYFEYTADS